MYTYVITVILYTRILFIARLRTPTHSPRDNVLFSASVFLAVLCEISLHPDVHIAISRQECMQRRL